MAVEADTPSFLFQGLCETKAYMFKIKTNNSAAVKASVLIEMIEMGHLADNQPPGEITNQQLPRRTKRPTSVATATAPLVLTPTFLVSTTSERRDGSPLPGPAPNGPGHGTPSPGTPCSRLPCGLCARWFCLGVVVCVSCGTDRASAPTTSWSNGMGSSCLSSDNLSLLFLCLFLTILGTEEKHLARFVVKVLLSFYDTVTNFCRAAICHNPTEWCPVKS